MIVTYEDDNTRGVISEEDQKSIALCVQMIASTVQGTVPYARSMGVKTILPRNNSEMAKSEYATDLTEAIEEWEDRISVREVGFTNDGETKVVINYGE